MKTAIKTIGLNVIISKVADGYVVERAVHWSRRDVLATVGTYVEALAIAQGAL